MIAIFIEGKKIDARSYFNEILIVNSFLFFFPTQSLVHNYNAET
jgi:hypothetical protein